MELRKSGIFSMSDIYDAIYIIHLPSGEMTPVSVDEKLERNRPKNQTAKDIRLSGNLLYIARALLLSGVAARDTGGEGNGNRTKVPAKKRGDRIRNGCNALLKGLRTGTCRTGIL